MSIYHDDNNVIYLSYKSLSFSKSCFFVNKNALFRLFWAKIPNRDYLYKFFSYFKNTPKSVFYLINKYCYHHYVMVCKYCGRMCAINLNNINKYKIKKWLQRFFICHILLTSYIFLRKEKLYEKELTENSSLFRSSRDGR